MALFNKLNQMVGKIIDAEDLPEAISSIRDTFGDKSDSTPSFSNSSLNMPAPPPVPTGMPSPLSVMVAMNGRQYGPYERATLIDMIAAGTLTRDTYVFIQGMSSWMPACNVPEVSMLFGAPAPPAPPLPFAPFAPAVPQPSAKPSNGMSDKLNSLINAAIADGEITDIERQVLIRNAQAEGVSMDEFVVILEGRLFEQRKKLEADQRKAHTAMTPPAAPPVVHANNTVKPGGLRKCPACNAVINKADACACPQCGYEFDKVGSASGNSLQPLLDKLNAIDNEMSSMGSFKLSFNAEKFYQRKVSAITSFIIPNNKAALTNFLMLAASNYSAAGRFDPIRKVWKGKSEEAMRRIKASHSSDAELTQLMESTAKTMGIKVKNL